MSLHHLLVGAASDGDKTKAPIEVDDFGLRRFAVTAGDRAKGGTALVDFLVFGFGARGQEGLIEEENALEEEDAVEEEDALEEKDDLIVLELLML